MSAILPQRQASPTLNGQTIIPNNPANVMHGSSFPMGGIGPGGPESHVIEQGKPFSLPPKAVILPPTKITAIPATPIVAPAPDEAVGIAGHFSLHWKEEKAESRAYVKASNHPNIPILADTAANLFLRPPPEGVGQLSETSDPNAGIIFCVESESQVVLGLKSLQVDSLELAVFGVVKMVNEEDGTLKMQPVVATTPENHSGPHRYPIHIWNADNGKLIHTLPGHSAKITRMVFSPEGTMMASGALDTTVKMWDPETGAVIGELPWAIEGQSRSAITAIAFNSDGSLLAASSGGDCRMWELSAGRLLTRPGLVPIPPKGDPIHSIAFYPKYGTNLPPNISLTAPPSGWSFAAATGSRIILWDASNRQTKMYCGPVKRPTVAAPPASILPSVSKLIATPQTVEIQAPTKLENVVIKADQSGEYFMAASSGNDAFIWRLMLDIDFGSRADIIGNFSEVGQIPNCILRGHKGHINQVIFSPDGKYVVTCSADHTVMIWATETGLLLRVCEETLDNKSNAADLISISPGGLKSVGSTKRKKMAAWEEGVGGSLEEIVSVGWFEGSDFYALGDTGMISSWKSKGVALLSEKYGDVFPLTRASRTDEWRESNMLTVDLGWTSELWERARKDGRIREAALLFDHFDNDFAGRFNGLLYLLESPSPANVTRARNLLEKMKITFEDDSVFLQAVRAGNFACGSKTRIFMVRELVLLLLWSRCNQDWGMDAETKYQLDFLNLDIFRPDDDDDNDEHADPDRRVSAILEQQITPDVHRIYGRNPNFFRFKDKHGRTTLHWISANLSSPADQSMPEQDPVGATILDSLGYSETRDAQDNFGLTPYDIALLRYQHAVEMVPEDEEIADEKAEAETARVEKGLTITLLSFGLLLSPLLFLAYIFNFLVGGFFSAIVRAFNRLPFMMRRVIKLSVPEYTPSPDPYKASEEEPPSRTAPHRFNLSTMTMENPLPPNTFSCNVRSKLTEESSAAWGLKIFSKCPAIEFRRHRFATINGLGSVIGQTIFLGILGLVAQNAMRGGSSSWQFEDSLSGNFISSQFGVNHHTFMDIGDADEWFEWVNNAFIPGLYVPKYWDEANGVARNDTFILGSIRLRQKRVKLRDYCGIGFSQKDRYCLPNYEYGFEQTGDSDIFGTYSDGDGIDYLGILYNYFSQGGYIVDIPYGNVTETTAAIQKLQDDGWVDLGTRLLIFQFNVVSVPLDQVAVLSLNTELPGSGGARVSPFITIFKPNRYSDMREDWWRVIIDLLYAAGVLIFLGQEVTEMKTEGLGYWKNFWNPYEFFLALLCVVGVLLRIATLGVPGAETLRAALRSDGSTPLDYVDLQPLAFAFQSELSVLAFILIFSWLRLMKFLRAFPFIGPVVSAIIGALFSLGTLIFLGILCLLIIAFGYANYIELGQSVQNYSEFMSAIMSQFRASFLADIDYSVITSKSLIGGSIIYIMSSIFVIVLVLNLFIGVLSEEYTTARENAQENWELDVSLRMAEDAKQKFYRAYREYFGPTAALPELVFTVPDSKEAPDTRHPLERRMIAMEHRISRLQQIIEERLPEPEHLVRKKMLITQASKYKSVHEAAWARNANAVMGWIEFKNAPIDATDGRGYACLHIAASLGLDQLVEYLLKRGSDVLKLTRKKFRSCLHLAAQNGHNATLKIILGFATNDLNDCKDISGWTAMHFAADANNADGIRELVADETNPNVIDMVGKTPLMVAADRGHLEACRALVSARAILTTRDHDGLTALEMAQMKNHVAVIDYLSNCDAPWALL